MSNSRTIKASSLIVTLCLFGFGYRFSQAVADTTKAAGPEWAMNASIIEACSCPMFCQCYFNHEPAGHAAMNMGPGHEMHHHDHFCKFNNAYHVNHGNYGTVKLDGAKFWLAGDLGSDFSKGKMDWSVLTFDPSVTKEQRAGIQAILAKVYPVQWNSSTLGTDAPIAWDASKDRSVAKLGDGKIAEVALNRFPGMTNDPIVIKNLKYWGAPRNDGFLLMPNEVEAYRAGEKAFEFKGTNGFMITFDINSKDVI
jgi:hypothetical protein